MTDSRAGDHDDPSKLVISTASVPGITPKQTVVSVIVPTDDRQAPLIFGVYPLVEMMSKTSHRFELEEYSPRTAEYHGLLWVQCFEQDALGLHLRCIDTRWKIFIRVLGEHTGQIELTAGCSRSCGSSGRPSGRTSQAWREDSHKALSRCHPNLGDLIVQSSTRRYTVTP